MSRRWGAAWNFFTTALTERGPPTPQELLQAAMDNPAVSEWRRRQLEGTATTHGPSWNWSDAIGAVADDRGYIEPGLQDAIVAA
eukprot:7379020-Alexandrium_andersonii.AAC.1